MKACSIRAILSSLVILASALPVRAEVVITDSEGVKTVIKDNSRIVSVGGTVTEIICALGAESKIVGVDSSSVFPHQMSKLPQVGYQRTLSAEGVLSLKPSLILASDEAGPPPIVKQLRESGIPYISVRATHSIEGVCEKIRLVAEVLQMESKGEELVAKLNAALAALPPKRGGSPKVLFVYARGAGTLNIAGKDTAADAIISIAGGKNAVSGYSSYKPMTAEALVTAAPDYILLTSRGLESLGGVDGLLKQPGIAQTPAGKGKRIIAMDDLLLLGFGPRVGDAVAELASKIHDTKSTRHVSSP